MKKKVFTAKNKAIVVAPYSLSDSEVKELETKFPVLKGKQIKTAVDPELLAGVVLYVETEMMDMSLKSGLQNLQNFMYESR